MNAPRSNSHFKDFDQTFFVSSLNLICIVGFDGYFKQISPAFERALGYSVPDLQAKPFMEFMDLDDRTQTLKEFVDLSTGNAPLYFENRYQHPDGPYRWFVWNAYSDHDNQLIYAVAHDVTEQKQAYTENTDKLRAYFTTPAVAIIVSNKQGRITVANRIAEILFGYDNHELVGVSIDQLVPPSKRKIHQQYRDAYIAQPNLRPMGATAEVYGLRKNNTTFPVKVALNSIITGDNHIVVSFIVDITGQKQIEHQQQDQLIWSETIREALVTLTSTLDLKEVLKQILVQLTSIISYDSATVFSCENNRFRTVLQQGDSPTPFPLRLQSPDDIDKAVRVNEWVRLNSESDGCHLYLTSLPDGERIVITLLAHGQIIGLINLDRLGHNLDKLTPLEIERISILTQYASIAVANAQIYETLQNNLEDQKKLEHATTFIMSARSRNELAQQVIDAVVQDFDQLDCGIFLKQDSLPDDPNTSIRLERVARTGQYEVNVSTPVYYDGPGLVPYAVRQVKALYVPDVSQNEHYIANMSDTQSELVIPLNTCFGVIGALDLQSPKRDAFSDRDRKILSSFAERAALAFENVYLLEVLQEFAAELEQRVIDRTEELSEEKSQVEAILQNIDQVIMLVDEKGIIQRTNPSFTKYFGYTSGVALPLKHLVLNEMSHEVEKALSLAKQTRRSIYLEVTCKRKDDSTFEGDFTLSPILGLDNQLSTIVCTLRDITQHKIIETTLRDALNKEQELNTLKTGFIAMTSHEFRTPLATIQASFDLLRRYEDRMSTEDKKQRFEKIERTIQHMTSMLEDILTISRVEAGTIDFNPTSINIKSFVADLIEDFKLESDCQHNFVFEHRGADYHYYVDIKLMRQIVTNLLSNAVKYSPPATLITTCVECNTENFVLHIADEGIGIPIDDHKHLFETFHRASNVGATPGTGLGLKVVQQSVDIHQGHISFTSKVGEGTTFTITIPNIKERE